MTASGPLLILTMPGFGIQVLRHLVLAAAWPQDGVTIALVGERPPRWRRAAAWSRRAWQRPEDRLHPMADGTLMAHDAERFLQTQGRSWCWLASDDAVREQRARLQPALTVTITSRILFSARTLANGGGDWLNVHPGLLPEYAGAAPAPFMFFDGVGGCTIHVMAAKVDAGAPVDRAPMSGPLGRDGAEYFFERLPVHTAGRLAAMLSAWAVGEAWPRADTLAPQVLRQCSSRRLAAARRLDWSWSSERMVRWVASLSGIAPAFFEDAASRRVEIMVAEAGPEVLTHPPGTVVECRDRRLGVVCANGSTILLRCRSRPVLHKGLRLPLPAIGAAA